MNKFGEKVKFNIVTTHYHYYDKKKNICKKIERNIWYHVEKELFLQYQLSIHISDYSEKHVLKTFFDNSQGVLNGITKNIFTRRIFLR